MVCITSVSHLGVTEEGSEGLERSPKHRHEFGTNSSSGVEGKLNFYIGNFMHCLWTHMNPNGYLSYGVIKKFGFTQKRGGCKRLNYQSLGELALQLPTP